MTSDPPRLKDGAGPSRRLLRAAEIDRPSNAARRRALAVAGAVTTLGATSAVAAATSGAVAKGVLFWVCVGAAGGGTISLAVSELVEPATSPAPSTGLAVPARAAASLPSTAQVAAPQQVEAPGPAAPALPPAAPALVSQEAASSSDSWRDGLPAASAASFGDDPQVKPTLFDELRLIEAARASVGRGAPSAALSVLDAYDKAYPGGQFQPEALALRIQALSQSGNVAGARALLSRFQQRYPQHPLLARARAAVGE